MNNNGGTDLAKVLWYYNLLPDSSSLNQKIVCPFHGDENPSMLVNLEDGNYYCFGCGESGDARKFVATMEKRNGLNDLQAYGKFLKILKSDKCSDIKITGTIRKKRKSIKRELYAQAYDYYHGLSKVDWQNTDDDDAIKAREYMRNRGFSAKTLMKCGAKVNYSQNYGLIFPMMDNGKFKGWVCRTMIKAVEQRRKYLYNEGFSRATTLVGNYGKKNYVIVVEGYMDRLKFVQFGEDNVVAILGWKMSQEQEQKLKKAGIKYVISALDNDECGRKGTEYLRSKFKVIRFSYLKKVKDPGDMTKELFDKMYSRTMKLLEKEIQK